MGNVYLEAVTKKKLYIVGGPDLEGYMLVIYKALYGKKSSGLRWAQKIHGIMLQLGFHLARLGTKDPWHYVTIGFSPCKTDPCVWLKKYKDGKKYEYAVIYVDDLLIACESASEFIQVLNKKLNLKIRGDGPLEYHLGCEYHLDLDGTLVALPKRYIIKIFDSLTKMFPGKPLPMSCPHWIRIIMLS